MYPREPLAAGAFINSASSCFSVSAVAFGVAEMPGRAMGRTMVATRKATARNGRFDFMLPPGIARLFYSDGRRWLARWEIKAHAKLREFRGRREMRVHPGPTSRRKQKHGRGFVTLAAIIMKNLHLSLLVLLVLGIVVPETVSAQTSNLPDQATPQEKHLRNEHQLTFGGQNAEAYFSADGKKLIFQSSHGDVKCDQIFIMNIDGSDEHMVSTGKGRTTCSFFYPNGKKILYASTHLASPECPPRPDFSKGYVWAVYSGYDIFTANPDGSNLKQLTSTPGYDAEATISLDGKKIVFTSMRHGDLDIYSMDADGTHVKQLTHEL